MNRVPAWFERKFEFSFPVDLYPNLCTRLRGTPARLEELLRAASGETLVRKPEGKWSAQEHAGHLADLEPLWLARVVDYESDSSELTAADLRNRKTDDAKHNARPLNDVLAEFRTSREKLLRRLDDLDESLFSRVIPHPRLKAPMRLVDHLFFVAEHDDHHLARVWEILRLKKSSDISGDHTMIEIIGLVCVRTSPMCTVGTPSDFKELSSRAESF